MKLQIKAQDSRWITNNELIVWKKVLNSLKKQNKFLNDNLDRLLDSEREKELDRLEDITKNNTLVLKWMEDGYMVEFRKDMWLYTMVDEITTQIWKASVIWYTTSFRRSEKILIANWIEYNRALATQYTELFWELQLSDYVWSITRTTKVDVLRTVQKWVIEQKTRQEVAKDISNLNSTLFSKNRADMIAQTEISKAYEYWNYLPWKLAQEQWLTVMKYWSTVWDNRVRPEHTACEDYWRVPFDFSYPPIWQGFSPEWVRCRCTMLQDIK